MAPRLAHPRRGAAVVVALAALAGLATGCGGQRQDADEPSGFFHVRVTHASFPAQQAIAREATMRIQVRNADRRTLPDVAVTVETRPEGRDHRGAPHAFGTADTADSRLADPARPVWVVDRQPTAGQTAYTNTWALGRTNPGKTRRFVWHLLPVKPGRYRVNWRVSPGLDGKARPARGERVRGSFAVTISAKPVPATVDDSGNVVRGKATGGSSAPR